MAGEKNSQPGTDTLLALVDTFVLKIPPKPGVKGQKMEGALTPAEEMQLLMSIHSQLEEQQSLEMRYCMFEAIFGGSGGDKDKQVPACLGLHVDLIYEQHPSLFLVKFYVDFVPMYMYVFVTFMVLGLLCRFLLVLTSHTRPWANWCHCVSVWRAVLSCPVLPHGCR